MSQDTSRPDLSIPDSYSPTFARALYDHRVGNMTFEVIRELKTRYGTEKFFLEAVESIYEHNSWQLGIKVKRDLKRIFKEG